MDPIVALLIAFSALSISPELIAPDGLTEEEWNSAVDAVIEHCSADASTGVIPGFCFDQLRSATYYAVPSNGCGRLTDPAVFDTVAERLAQARRIKYCGLLSLRFSEPNSVTTVRLRRVGESWFILETERINVCW